MRRILIRGARQLLTLQGPSGPRRGDSLQQLGIIEDGSILISNGAITHVGPSRRIENLAEAKLAEEVSASGKVVMPGFIDTHTRVVASPARFLGFPFAPRENPEVIAAGLQFVRSASSSKLEFHARRVADNFLRHGTTTIESKSGYGGAESLEIKGLKVLMALRESCIDVAATFTGADVLPADFSGNADAYIQLLGSETLAKIGSRRLAQFAGAVCADDGFTASQLHSYFGAARKHGLWPRLYAEDSRHGAVELAMQVEAASIDGLNDAIASDAEMLARSRTIATLLPGLTHQGACSRYAPARLLIDAGAAISLATGFHLSTNSTFNMQAIIALACTQMALTPEEAISSVTINAAHAILRANSIGSLEFGKDADVILLEVSDYRELACHFGVNPIAMTIRKGNIVYRQGEVQCTDRS